jgi:hypothetical protein
MSQMRRGWRSVVAVLIVCAAPRLIAAQPTMGASTSRLTTARLKALKSTSNDPAGDSFIGQPEELRALVDAFVADTSLASPMLLFMASNTALRQGQIEQAGFLFYAAEIREVFDLDRYDISSVPDGNNAITYLMFLKGTTGMGVNPAIMREPSQFAAVIARLETWEVVPSPDAYYPDFAEAKGFKLPRQRWAARAREIKEDFLTKFGRRVAKLLADPEYAKALRFVVDARFGTTEPDDKTMAQIEASFQTMNAIEARLLPGERPDWPTGRALEPDAPVAPPAPDLEQEPVRVGGDIPEPKKVRHVDPKFPSGSRGTVLFDLTINRQGKVVDVHLLRGDATLVKPAEEAVRQWRYVPVLVDGRPVPVLLTVSVSAAR